MENLRFKDYLKDYLEYYNITNKEFANRLGISQKHLIDILSGEMDISANVIEKISLITDISAEYILKIEANYKLEKLIQEYLEENKLTMTQYLNKYNYKYLIENNYMKFIDVNDKKEIIKDILKFLRVTEPKMVYNIDSKAYYKSKNDKPELLFLWLEKCYKETYNQSVREYKKENIEILIEYIRKSAKEDKFDEKELIRKFNENGIFLVVQEDIPGSKIRGAFKVHRGIPAIYITYKYHRIADIYFALLHELAHCKTDFNKAQGTSLVSYEEDNDENETKADMQAFDWMIDNKYFDKIVKSKTYKIENEEKYPKSFVVYRLAKEEILKYSSKEYQKYNRIIKN